VEILKYYYGRLYYQVAISFYNRIKLIKFSILNLRKPVFLFLAQVFFLSYNQKLFGDFFYPFLEHRKRVSRYDRIYPKLLSYNTE